MGLFGARGTFRGRGQARRRKRRRNIVPVERRRVPSQWGIIVRETGLVRVIRAFPPRLRGDLGVSCTRGTVRGYLSPRRGNPRQGAPIRATLWFIPPRAGGPKSLASMDTDASISPPACGETKGGCARGKPRASVGGIGAPHAGSHGGRVGWHRGVAFAACPSQCLLKQKRHAHDMNPRFFRAVGAGQRGERLYLAGILTAWKTAALPRRETARRRPPWGFWATTT